MSAVKRVPSLASIAVTRIRGWRTKPAARARRSAKGAMPATGFSGFWGDTSHHTSSSLRRFSATSLM